MIDIKRFLPALLPLSILLTLLSCQSVRRSFQGEAAPAMSVESERPSEGVVIEYHGPGIMEPRDRMLPLPVIHEAFDVYTLRQSEGESKGRIEEHSITQLPDVFIPEEKADTFDLEFPYDDFDYVEATASHSYWEYVSKTDLETERKTESVVSTIPLKKKADKVVHEERKPPAARSHRASPSRSTTTGLPMSVPRTRHLSRTMSLPS